MLFLYTLRLPILLGTTILRWLLVRASTTSNYIDEIHRIRVDNLLKEVRREFPEEYPTFLKIRAYYVKNQASNTTIYTGLTKLRSACKTSRQLFGKTINKANQRRMGSTISTPIQHIQ